MESRRRFLPPWRVEEGGPEVFYVRDANGVRLTSVLCRDDLKKWSFGHDYLSSDEARRIAKAIARLPEFMMPRRGFYQRGCSKPERPYHVALADGYVRKHWDTISTLCRLNSLPFNATGEKIEADGLWCVYEFTWQMDAI